MADAGHLLGGLVAGEGCFRGTDRRERFIDGSTRRRFVFEVSLATSDRPLLVALRAALGGAGTIRDRPPRKAHWQPESYRYGRRAPQHDDVAIYTVQSTKELRRVIVPFMDMYLPPSGKRRQYEAWRERLCAYSPAAAGSSVTSVSQSILEASDQRRSRS